ncbi:MAG: hypothetical protein AAGM38_18880 [Pseudomonadota bacterium]
MRSPYYKDRRADWVGGVLGTLLALWALNTLSVWLFAYPAVYCVAAALTTEVVREGYKLLGFALVITFMAAMFVAGPRRRRRTSL